MCIHLATWSVILGFDVLKWTWKKCRCIYPKRHFVARWTIPTGLKGGPSPAYILSPSFSGRPYRGPVDIMGIMYAWYISGVRHPFSAIHTKCTYIEYWSLKPHCIWIIEQSSRVLVPAGTSKSTLRHHGIQAVTRVMAYVADAVRYDVQHVPILKKPGPGCSKSKRCS
jgi:hypothetical protein